MGPGRGESADAWRSLKKCFGSSATKRARGMRTLGTPSCCLRKGWAYSCTTARQHAGLAPSSRGPRPRSAGANDSAPSTVAAARGCRRRRASGSAGYSATGRRLPSPLHQPRIVAMLTRGNERSSSSSSSGGSIRMQHQTRQHSDGTDNAPVTARLQTLWRQRV